MQKLAWIKQSVVFYRRYCFTSNSPVSGHLSSNSINHLPVPSSVNSFCLRTHTCGELRPEHIGSDVELYGWLDRKRFNKFLLLRDSYGAVQACISDDRMAEFEPTVNQINLESVIKVKGKVVSRRTNQNKKMATGEIEVLIDELQVLNSFPLANPIANKPQQNESDENARLTHRYLDLRSPAMQYNLRLRSKLLKRMRNFLQDNSGFVEVDTPILSQLTPGGAAEFVVPAAYPHTGQFYSLPQSPQIYKQLLMCGGVDRYFQIAKCFRDESTRSDRQPEFTQVDLEVSFTDQESIILLVEQLIWNSWPDELLDYRPNIPFERISHAEAASKYKTDKPDLRKGKLDSNSRRQFKFLWVLNFPLFTQGKNGSIESTHHPFTAPIPEHLSFLKNGQNLLDIQAQHYDLVLNGVELGGGSIRIHDSNLQKHVLENVLQVKSETMNNFIKALSFGAPPHGGFALGLDRYISLLAGPENAKSIRDVIAFPKSTKKRCNMMGAPSVPPAEVLKRYSIRTTEDQDTLF